MEKLFNELNVEVVPLTSGGVRGFLHRPHGNGQHAMILAHGAGANAQAPLLVAAASALARVGIATLRCDLPFRQRKPHGPPSPADAAADRANLREAVEHLRTLANG